MTEFHPPSSTVPSPSGAQAKPVADHTTVAISVLVHGEAVRFNRGKARGDDFDFKYMKDGRGNVYPYVSAQCFKKYWRESLPTVASPITRAKNAAGAEKNQAATSGNPFDYVDDDLFGYMIAGAAADDDSASEADASDDTDQVSGVAEVDASLDQYLFTAEDVKDAAKVIERFKEDTPFGKYFLGRYKPHSQASEEDESSSGLLETLNAALRDPGFAAATDSKHTVKEAKVLADGDSEKVAALNRELLLKAFPKGLKKEEKKKRVTSRRTAPIRMHALLAFSGIKTAKDFQTFSRDVALTGKNSILNPNTVGVYSGWLKTRVLIEASRIGKFFVGPNLDVLANEVVGREIKKEENPYDRAKGTVDYIQLGDAERRERLKLAIEALANVGNNQGPASGALHDGSLKPKGFIGAVMNCADSPFDAVWQGTSDQPIFDVLRLEAVLADWDDLFLERRIYVGLPVELVAGETADALKLDIEERARKQNFEAVVGSPRKILLQFAAAAALAAVPQT